MKRTVAREIAVRLCFSLSENPTDPHSYMENVFEESYYATLKDEDELYDTNPDVSQLEYINRLVIGVFDHSAELDGYIDKYAVGWRFGRISRTAVAIMKAAMYEVLYMPDIPNRAAINEAIELAKSYDPPETVAFINGVLGAFSRSEMSEETGNK